MGRGVRSRWRRLGRGLALTLGAALLGAGGWALFWTLYNPAVTLAEPLRLERPRRGGDVTVLLGGDFAPVDRALPLIRRHGPRYPYLATAPLLQRADITLLNLEAPVTDHPELFPLYKYYNYRVAPGAVPAMRWLGLDLLSLANNHIKDRRDRGLLDTLHHLRAGGIATVGTGQSEAEARRPVIVEVGGVRVGFLAYLEDWAWYNLYLRINAVGGRPGCARFVEADVRADVARLRPLVDLLVVSVHWGKTYAPVSAGQRRMARFLAGLGVDVVAGHHSHDVQAVGRVGRTLVFYSLGNYAWGTPGHHRMRVGLLARLCLEDAPGGGARLGGVTLLPIVTQNRIVNYQPRPIRPGELPWIRPLIRASRAEGVTLRPRGTELEMDPASLPAGRAQ